MTSTASGTGATAGRQTEPEQLEQLPGRVVPIDAASDARWLRFVESHPAASVYHHPAWLTVLRSAYGYEPCSLAFEDRAGELRGVLPLVRSRGLLTGTRVASLPRTPVAGPVATDAEADLALARAAIAIGTSGDRPRIELRLPSRRFGASVAGAEAVPSDAVYVLDLPDDPAQLRFGSSRNHGRVRWAVKKAERSGLRIRAADTVRDLRDWYALYLETMRDHVQPPVPYRFMTSMWHELGPPGLMTLLLAEQHGRGRPRLIAGSLFLSFGRTVTYAHNGRRRRDLALRPNDYIQWVAIHEACSSGRRLYDFGEVAEMEGGLAQFKAKWGAEQTAPYRYVYPPGTGGGGGLAARLRAAELVRRGWKHVPLRVTAAAGNVLYRYG